MYKFVLLLIIIWQRARRVFVKTASEIESSCMYPEGLDFELEFEASAMRDSKAENRWLVQ